MLANLRDAGSSITPPFITMTVPNGHFWKTGNSAIAEGVGKHLSAQEIDDLNAKLDAASPDAAKLALIEAP